MGYKGEQSFLLHGDLMIWRYVTSVGLLRHHLT